MFSDSTRIGVRCIGGLVGAGRADVRDDGRTAAVRGRQRGGPVRVDSPRRRPLSGLAQQGGRANTERGNDKT